MFYYPAVLKRHSGCFSTIWLVATKGIKVPRREFLKVNVTNTCDDIMNYLLERVPAPWPGLPQPRFSLYLSSQLQYGVIVVYHRQCAIFLQEIQFLLAQLLKKKGSKNIDMEGSRPPLDLPDALSVLQESEGAADPLFGVMYSTHDALASPTALQEMSREYLRDSSPEADGLSGITASQETITMREPQPIAFPAPEFEGAELGDHDPNILELLMAQADNFSEGDVEMPGGEVTPGEAEREIQRAEREGDVEREGAKEPTPSIIELQPTTLSGEDAMLLPPEKTDLLDEMPPLPSDRSTPVAEPGFPAPARGKRGRQEKSVELQHISPPEVTRRGRKRRQLVFFDLETQLSEEVLQKQINNPLIETNQQVLLLPAPPRIPAAELLQRPCNFLSPDIELLWKQAATITPISGSTLQVGERGSESTDSEREHERELEIMMAAGRDEVRLELDPEEALRAAAQVEMFEMSAQGSLPLEGSDQRDVTREISPVFKSDREGSTLSRSVSMLQDIPEGADELPERATQSPGLLPELSEREEHTLFHSLFPPEADRRTVSNFFHRLLESLSAREVQVEQLQPYGDILISPDFGRVRPHVTT